MPLTMRRERGFTVVEIVVAAFVVTSVLAGAIYFASGAGRSQQRSSARAYMTSTADRVAQELRANPTTWLDNETRTRCAPARGGCQVDLRTIFSGGETASGSTRQRVDLKSRDGMPRVRVAAKITTVNSAADNGTSGRGSDADSINADLYRLNVTVRLHPEETAKWGADVLQPVELQTMLDPSVLGSPTGTLDVNVCRVLNQTDERMAIDGCTRETKRIEMAPQADCPNSAPGDRFILGCNHAFDAAPAARRKVEIRAENSVQFKLVPVSSGRTRLSSTADGGERLRNGTFRFSDLKAGTYELRITARPRGTEHWPTRSLPEGTTANRMRIAVYPNQVATALLVLRPEQESLANRHTVTFQRTVYNRILTPYDDGPHPEPKVTRAYSDDPDKSFSYQYEYTIHYLVNTSVQEVRVPGPSWSGSVFMGAKPTGRYSAVDLNRSGDLEDRVFSAGMKWKQVKPGGATPNGVVGSVEFKRLPTGLLSRPTQILGVTKDGRGRLLAPEDEGALNRPLRWYPGKPFANEVRGIWSSGDDYVWIEPGGRTSSRQTIFDDRETGECYVTTVGVPGWKADWAISSGYSKGDRCDTNLYQWQFTAWGYQFGVKRNFFSSTRSQPSNQRLQIGVTRTLKSCSGCSDISGGGSMSTPGDGPVASAPAPTAVGPDGSSVGSSTNG